MALLKLADSVEIRTFNNVSDILQIFDGHAEAYLRSLNMAFASGLACSIRFGVEVSSLPSAPSARAELSSMQEQERGALLVQDIRYIPILTSRER